MNKDLHFSSSKDDWTTPAWLFELLNERYYFTIDLFASKDNALCKKYFTDCFNQGHLITDKDSCFGNPPYRRLKPTTWDFVTWAKNYKSVLILPARTDTVVFHKYCMPDKCGWHLVKGRIKFGDTNSDKKNPAPFASIVTVFNGPTGVLETIDAGKRTWKK